MGGWSEKMYTEPTRRFVWSVFYRPPSRASVRHQGSIQKRGWWSPIDPGGERTTNEIYLRSEDDGRTQSRCRTYLVPWPRTRPRLRCAVRTHPGGSTRVRPTWPPPPGSCVASSSRSDDFGATSSPDILLQQRASTCENAKKVWNDRRTVSLFGNVDVGLYLLNSPLKTSRRSPSRFSSFPRNPLGAAPRRTNGGRRWGPRRCRRQVFQREETRVW